MKRIWLALVLLGCSPDNDANCESICELAAECSTEEVTIDQVGDCVDDCLKEANDDRVCANALEEFVLCLDGDCGDPDCASEADDFVDTCY